MKKLLLAAMLGLALVKSGSVVSQPMPATQSAPFTLSIHTAKGSYKSGEAIVVVVEKTNVSRHAINASHALNPIAWYGMEVVGPDGPAEETEEYRNFRHPKIKDWPEGSDGGSAIMDILKPGQTGEDKVPVSSYRQMTKSGKYEITFTDDTLPGRPEKSIPVRSNTITVTITE